MRDLILEKMRTDESPNVCIQFSHTSDSIEIITKMESVPIYRVITKMESVPIYTVYRVLASCKSVCQFTTSMIPV
jgi:hypothetical protein